MKLLKASRGSPTDRLCDLFIKQNSSPSQNESVMPVAVIVCVVLFAVLLLGVLWALIVFVPIDAAAGPAAQAVKKARREFDVQAAVQRDAAGQRAFNEQETRAWCALIEKD